MQVTTRVLAAMMMAVSCYAHGDEPTVPKRLNDQSFRELHAALQVSKQEPWQTIPWKIALLDAQRTAAEQRKPIFIWAMDGHPLGCT